MVLKRIFKGMNREILVVSGGYADLDFIRSIIDEKERYIIGVDRGLETLEVLGIKADLAVGDFDSAPQHIKALYDEDHTFKFNQEKDYTDTHLAVLEALKQKTPSDYSGGCYRRKTGSHAWKHKPAFHLRKGKCTGIYAGSKIR